MSEALPAFRSTRRRARMAPWAGIRPADPDRSRRVGSRRAALADPKRNPLQGCDPKTIKHFTKNLKFKNGGLGHADYSLVGKELSRCCGEELETPRAACRRALDCACAVFGIAPLGMIALGAAAGLLPAIKAYATEVVRTLKQLP